MKIRTLIADDHPVVLDGLITMLEHHDEIDIVHKATSGADVRYIIPGKNIDVALLDINLGDQSGINICEWISQEFPQIKVIGFSIYEDPVIIDDMIKRGAHGYLFKDAERDEIVNAIKTVHRGGLHFKGKIAEILKGTSNMSDPVLTDKLPKISRREKEVLRLIIQEFTNKEIAAKLFISPATVISHRKNLLRKLEVKNTAGLVRKAIRFQLL